MRLGSAGQIRRANTGGAGSVELRRVPAAGGEQTRVWIVDDKHGWVLEQRLYNARNQLLATARATQHRFYAAENVSLPHRINIKFHRPQLALSISVTNYQINSLFWQPGTVVGVAAIRRLSVRRFDRPKHAAFRGRVATGLCATGFDCDRAPLPRPQRHKPYCSPPRIQPVPSFRTAHGGASTRTTAVTRRYAEHGLA